MLFNDYLQAGGERVSVSTEYAALREAGVDVRLLTVQNDRLSQMSPIGKMLATFPNEDSKTLVADEIARFKPHIVHAQNLFPQLGAGAISALREHQTPWVRSIRNYRKACIAGTLTRDGKPCTDCLGKLGKAPGIVHGCYQGSRAASIGATNYAWWEDRHERAHPPAAYILISNAMKKNIETKLNPKAAVRVVHNAVKAIDVPLIPMANRRHDVAFVGRFAPEKGISLTLNIAKLLPDTSFVFAGSGPLLEDVRRAAEKESNIECVTDLSPDGAMRLMSDSRVVVVPSQWEEPFGRVAAEALATGAIPMVSRYGGLPEIVSPVDARLVIDSDDPQTWADEIHELLSADPSVLDSMSASSVERWNASFSSRASAAHLQGVYQEFARRD
ncbi:glycosyltransferase [Agreia sp. Leaf283]|uniref:glycosyltransferase n=1 Tax=Agreia sp. Leaf283 TaxID=1736321 RepID=UPI000A48FA82|nr:glycosyltransferase [Agreia sp. Leaf283]